MTHTSTQQPEALNLEEFRAKVTRAAVEPLFVRIAELEAQIAAAQKGVQAAVQDGWMLVPVEPTEKMISEGSCAQTLKHGHQYIGECAAKTAWSFMLAVAPKPPAAAPMQMPKPVGWFHRNPKEYKNGEVCNYRIAPADRKYGCEEFPLYTEQQVRALLAEVSAPAAQATLVAHRACKPDMLVNGGALKLALNVLRRAGKNEVADELEATAARCNMGCKNQRSHECQSQAGEQL